MSEDDSKLSELMELLDTLVEWSKRENGMRPHLFSLRAMRNMFQRAIESDLTDDEAITVLREQWVKLNARSHHQSFNSMHIWRDDFDERMRLNDELDQKKERIESLIGYREDTS
jgi:exonuclease V gamma subunit